MIQVQQTGGYALIQAATGIPARTSDGRAHIYVSRAEAAEAWRMGGAPDSIAIVPVGIVPAEEREEPPHA